MAPFFAVETCSKLAKGFSISCVKGINVHGIGVRSRGWVSRGILVDKGPGVVGAGCFLRS